jgi:integrase
VDISVLLPSGKRHRERRKLAGSYSKTTAKDWGVRRERALLLDGPSKPKKEVPTLNEFAPRFIDGYARANRQKPSGIAAKLTILNTHLVPALGSRKLDAINSEDVQRLKHRLSNKSPKTVNNTLTVLNVLLKTAVEWQVIEHVPCSIRLLPIPKGSAQFHDFEAFERLVGASAQLDRQTHLIVLLGGEAGLRCGEMMALQWDDVDLEKRQLRIERSDWKGQVTSTKGGRVRFVPMTVRLATALRQQRHLRARRVLVQTTGDPLTQKIVQVSIRRAARSAHVQEGVHILRHTFCSHLAMRGAPARAIQELAGHQDLSTTQRYMHLSPAAIEGAIRLLDQAQPPIGFGDILETADLQSNKANG